MPNETPEEYVDEQNNMIKGHSSRRARSSRIVKPVRVTKQPVLRMRPHAMAWAKALELSGNDATRCKAQPDGSVIVFNHPVR